MKIAVFWDVMTCTLVESFPLFRRNVLPPFSGKTLFYPEDGRAFYQLTWHQIPESNNLQITVMF
jgi:hypothetical protein